MKVDILVRDAKVFNSFTKQFEAKHVSIIEDKFYYISEEDLAYLQPHTIIEAKDQYMIPGLIDIHMHIESSMTTPRIFSKAVLPFGVTTVVADAHEVGNVFGMAGLKEFMHDDTEIDIFYGIPSSVPSTLPEKETTGGFIGVEETAELLQWPNVICLGEAMNFKEITSEPDSLIRRIIRECQSKRPQLPLEGHCPKIYKEDLAAFLYSGISSDHTHQFPDSLYEKITNGMFIELQKKSITKENIAVIVANNFYEYASIITDDVMADDLLNGHLNENVKQAIACGLPVEQAIYMTTFTPARRMGLQDRGVIAPGKLADFILLDDLDTFDIQAVYKSGKQQFVKGQPFAFPEKIETFPPSFYESVHCKKLTAEDLELQVVTNKPTVRCQLIQKQEVGTFTEKVIKEIPVIDGVLQWQAAGYSLIVVLERYGKNGNIAYGLMERSFEKEGAIGTTWAHDHHNVMVMGNSIADILKVQHQLVDKQGGYFVAEEGQITGQCRLPIGGILSQEPIDVLGNELNSVRNAMRNLGYKNSNEIMSFSTLSLPVSPAIKMTDFGMLDTRTLAILPLVLAEDGYLKN